MAAWERWRGCCVCTTCVLLGRRTHCPACCLACSRPILSACCSACNHPSLPCLPRTQMAEDLAAAEARRAPVIAVQPTLRLNLPEALQQAPPRLDMCSECAQYVQKVRRRVGWGARAEHAMQAATAWTQRPG